MIKVLNKREKITFYSTIGVIIFAILFNFLIAPILTKNDNLNKEIAIARTKLKKYLWLLSQKDNIQKKYSKFTAAPEASGQQKDSLVSALSELEGLAKNANIKIIDIRPQAARPSERYKELVVDLRAEGTMEAYLKFIYDIENSLSLLRIKKFQLSAKPNTPALEGSFSISKVSLE